MAKAVKPTNDQVVRMLDQILGELDEAKKRHQQMEAQLERINKALQA